MLGTGWGGDITVHGEILNGEPFMGAHKFQAPPLDFGRYDGKLRTAVES